MAFQPSKALRLGAVAGLALVMTGCVSLGVDAPESLLTLSSQNVAPVGANTQNEDQAAENAIAVLPPETPAKLDVLRVPDNVSETEIAYLPDAFWIEKPARLFRRVLGENLRAKGGENGPIVLDSDVTPLRASTLLRGTLSELSYDAQTGEVVVRYDAIRSDTQGRTATRRFEARESGVSADAASVGPALNEAVNAVAVEVADWM